MDGNVMRWTVPRIKARLEAVRRQDVPAGADRDATLR